MCTDVDIVPSNGVSNGGVIRKKKNQSNNINNGVRIVTSNDVSNGGVIRKKNKSNSDVVGQKRKRKENIYQKYNELRKWKEQHRFLVMDYNNYYKLREHHTDVMRWFKNIQVENRQLRKLVNTQQDTINCLRNKIKELNEKTQDN